MHLSELLGAEALAADGASLGRVKDVRLVQDGPLVEGFGNGLRLEGMVVGGGLIGARLGFLRHEITAPWAIAALFRWRERSTAFYLWDAVESCDGGVVRLRPGATPVPLR